MRIVTIVGARPQFIKAAPLSLELRKQHEEFLVHTGQHYDENMSAVFFRELDIPAPDVHLGVGSGTHGEQTAGMLCGIEKILRERKPDTVIVYGDTNSTLAGALAAAKLHIPVAHVEAGLRSFNRDMPEEINRIVTDHVSTWMFAPSQTAVGHLANEGITKGVHNVGDIMADSVRIFTPRAAEGSDIVARLRLRTKEYCVATVHRACNTDSGENLVSLLGAFARLPLPVVFPMHPRTRVAVERCGIELNSISLIGTSHALSNNIVVTPPLGFLDMLQLQKHAAVVLTDSGGIQKEAYFLRVPCLTLREETEWVETLESGWNQLVGADPERILQGFRQTRAVVVPQHKPLYGDGFASTKISMLLGGVRAASDGK